MSLDPTAPSQAWDLDRVAEHGPSDAVMGAIRRTLLTVYTPRQVATWLDAHAGGDPAVLARKALRLCAVAAAHPPVRCPDGRSSTVDAEDAIDTPIDTTAAARIGRRSLTDLEALQVVTRMVRGLLGCTQPREVRTLLHLTVRRLGGRLTSPADVDHATLLLDLSLGVSGPLLATPDPAAGESAARHLRGHLPQLLEDAQDTLARLERTGRLADAADHDALTGLLNRRAYDRLAGRLGPGDVLVLIDLDGFKDVNDRYGHLAGDEVLRTFGSVLRGQVRIHEHAVRFGGDEFLVVLQASGPDASLRFVERLRIAWSRRRPLPVALSVGVAAVADDVDAALEDADRALYATRALRGAPPPCPGGPEEDP